MKKYYYTIGEVSNLLDLKPHVIRYWETEFRQLRPNKTRGGNRKYTRSDIDLITRIKDMLHNQKYTIEGAKKRLAKEASEPVQKEIFFADDRSAVKQNVIRELKDLKQLLKKLS